MKERPILMNAPMVRATLARTKTQTRRLMKPQPTPDPVMGGHHWPSNVVQSMVHVESQLMAGDPSWSGLAASVSPFGTRGDALWVRESWRPVGNGPLSECTGPDDVRFAASAGEAELATNRWRPSIHMPRWASRINLIVESVRVERLQDISEEDAIAEGILAFDGMLDDARICTRAKELGDCIDDARPWFAAAWEMLYGAASWDENPWVWVVTFSVLP